MIRTETFSYKRHSRKVNFIFIGLGMPSEERVCHVLIGCYFDPIACPSVDLGEKKHKHMEREGILGPGKLRCISQETSDLKV